VIPAEAKSQQEGGNARILATMSDRSAIIPDVKGMSELGYAVSMDNMKGLCCRSRAGRDRQVPRNAVQQGHERPARRRTGAENEHRTRYMDGPTFMKAMLATSQQVMELRKK